MPEFDDIDLLLMKYAEIFRRPFPIYGVTMTNGELKEALEKCIESGKPYEVEYEKDCMY